MNPRDKNSEQKLASIKARFSIGYDTTTFWSRTKSTLTVHADGSSRLTHVLVDGLRTGALHAILAHNSVLGEHIWAGELSPLSKNPFLSLPHASGELLHR